MELTAYITDEVRIHPAPLARDWMDATPQRFAYRCLPLNIANCHGWQVCARWPVSATWDGGHAKDAIHVWGGGASSHFGSGILTFYVPALFDLPDGWDLLVTGPFNQPKDGIAPLTGVVEPWTSFTMNWKFTRACTVEWAEDEPFCMVMPIKRGIENINPEMKRLSDYPERMAEFQRWSQSRNDFNANLKVPGSDACKQGWQRDYMRSADRTKLRCKPFG